MLDKIKKIFKRKPKAKVKKEILVLAEDKTFENEINKPEVKSETRETKSETTSSLTFGE
jgi:mannose/fructose/N-acetylgalactosamine-specific phosphotransferase system component IIB